MRKIDLGTNLTEFYQYTGLAKIEKDMNFYIKENGTRMLFLKKGTLLHFQNGRIHNDQGPAIEYSNEEYKIYINFILGNPHPTLPTIENYDENGSRLMYLNDDFQLHNLRGAAQILEQNKSISNNYYIKGVFIETEENFFAHPDVLEYNKNELKNKISKME